MKRVAVLPLDDRPVNYDYPRYLSRAAGLEILLPPREWLGNPWRASRHADLVNWLAQAAPRVDAMVVAIDTLAYGGLIPSRTSSESTDTVLARLEVLRGIHATRPQLPLLAFSVVMRINRSDSSEEEKPYCATYGNRLFQLSFLEHKAELGDASTDEIARRDSLRAEIPNEVYEDFRRGRARNYAVNRAMVDWVADGVFDYLLLPQDDTADFGWNVAEARSLQAYIRARRLTERAITYPGADEIGCLLLARYVCQQAGFKPKIWPRYSGVTTPSVITDYEDRPIHELLKAHLAPLGGVVASSPQEADLALFINGPVKAQGNGDSQWLILRGLAPSVRKCRPSSTPGSKSSVIPMGFATPVARCNRPLTTPKNLFALCAERSLRAIRWRWPTWPTSMPPILSWANFSASTLRWLPWRPMAAGIPPAIPWARFSPKRSFGSSHCAARSPATNWPRTSNFCSSVFSMTICTKPTNARVAWSKTCLPWAFLHPWNACRMTRPLPLRPAWTLTSAALPPTSVISLSHPVW